MPHDRDTVYDTTSAAKIITVNDERIETAVLTQKYMYNANDWGAGAEGGG